MFSPTDGPWQCETFDDGDSSVGVEPTDDLIYAEKNGRTYPICSVHQPIAFTRHPEDEGGIRPRLGLASSNRNLILAAPRMVALLSRVCEAMYYEHNAFNGSVLHMDVSRFLGGLRE